MATSLFPLSIPTFVDHRDLLDDVEAEHVNYLQREVNAIARTLGVNPQVGASSATSAQGSTVVAGTDYGSVAARLAVIEKAARSSRPVGEVAMFMGVTPPENWLFLNGATYSASQYPALYAKLGTTTLPDFRNRVPRGSGDTGIYGQVSGSDTVLLTGDQIPQHQHGLTTTRNENPASEAGQVGGGGIGYGWGLGQTIGTGPFKFQNNSTIGLGFQDRVVVYNGDVFRPRPYGAATALQHFNAQQTVNVVPRNLTVNFMIRAVSG